VEPNEQRQPVDWARYYRNLGICVVPAEGGSPKGEWKQYQTEFPTEDRIDGWFRGESFRKLQIFAICGRISNLVVLDCDSDGAETWWRQLLGDVMDQTACQLSGGGRGHHYFFRLGEADQRGRAGHYEHPELGTVKWDLRAEGGGVVLPPSPHRSGGTYTWVRDWSHLQDWPYPEIPGRGAHSHEGASATGDAQSLAWLLAHPGDGGRNNWVTSVLGHYAKRIPFKDGYEATAELVWSVASGIESDHAYERAEYEATVRSVWDTEVSKNCHAEKPTLEQGWLSGDGSHLFTICEAKGSGQFVAPYAQFDMKATSMITDPIGRTTYIVDVTIDTPQGLERLENMTLEAEKLGSHDQMSRWMAARRMVANPPGNDVYKTMPRNTRLQMYVESQSPQRVRSAPWMGWYDDEVLGSQYVTPAGMITARGLQADCGLVPDPRRATSYAEWEYGFEGSMADAQAILRETLTFHDSLATSIFGALWALAPIKGAIMRMSSLFPITAVVAPSEAGKTNGFFDMMLQANGRRQVGGTLTTASLRDGLALHRGGFVWIDDPSNIDDIGELLRGAANEGNYTKKGGVNWADSITIPLVAPIILSAEGVEMLRERAMADRTVELVVPSPVGRQSLRTDGPQWDDILALQHKAGHLSRYAGWYVQRAMQWLESIGGEEGLRHLTLALRVGSGRQSEKLALVRAGARALAYMIGDWEDRDLDGLMAGGVGEIDVVGLADDWAMGQASEDKVGPYLLQMVLPSYISARGFVPRHNSAPIDPVYLDSNGHLRVNVAGLASWWLGHSRSLANRDRAQQLGSPSALKAEARMLGWTHGLPVTGKRYMLTTIDEAKAVLADSGYDWTEMVQERQRSNG
jgi:hypothetical protein